MHVLEHTLIALLIQVAVGLTTRNWWAGAALACGYFIGRELAQAEYRWIETYGHGLRANAPWWAAFDARVWRTVDQIADFVGPVIATGTLALVIRKRRMRV